MRHHFFFLTDIALIKNNALHGAKIATWYHKQQRAFSTTVKRPVVIGGANLDITAEQYAEWNCLQLLLKFEEDIPAMRGCIVSAECDMGESG